MILFFVTFVVQPTPGASGDLYERAVVERRAGHPAAAAALLEKLVQGEPGNADAWVLLGFARRDAGNREGACVAFETALKIAPNYQDAKDGLASLDTYPGKRGTFTVPSVSIDASRTAVRGANNWTGIRGTVSAPVSAITGLTGSIEHDRRFGLTDTYLEGRMDMRPEPGIDVYASFGGTAHADFRPAWQARAGAAYKLTQSADPVILTIDGAAARYPTGRVSTLSPGFQRYFGGRGSWISGQWINVFAEGRHMTGGLARIDAMTTDSVRLYGGFARAPDLSDGQAIQTTSIFGGTSIALNDRFNWRASLARDVPSTGPRRLTVSVGVELRFR